MKRGRNLVLLSICLVTLAGGGVRGGSQQLTAARIDRSGDKVLRRTLVPSAERPQGEVRLLLRGEAAVVQTVLYSKLLKRTVGRIAAKERESWPPGSDGRPGAEAYIEALQRVWEEIDDRSRKNPRGQDRRQAMLIEFIASGEEALVAIEEPEITESAGELRILASRPVALLRPGRRYVLENMKLIAADALGLAPADAAVLLGLGSESCAAAAE